MSWLNQGLRLAQQVVNHVKRRDISDDFVKWLCFANAGMLDRGNLLLLDHAIGHLPSDAPILEIGSFCGLSTNLIAHFKRKHGVKNRLVTCDRWRFEDAGGNVGGSPVTHEEYRALVRDSFLRNVRTFSGGDLPYTIEMYSDELFAAWSQNTPATDVFQRPITLGGPISFCFIDGNHTYDFAKRDFDNTDRFLEPGGFVLFDDSADGSGWEVCRVVAELRGNPRYRLVDKNPNYLFQKLR
jgi:hypothetical protein